MEHGGEGVEVGAGTRGPVTEQFGCEIGQRPLGAESLQGLVSGQTRQTEIDDHQPAIEPGPVADQQIRRLEVAVNQVEVVQEGQGP